MQRHYKSILLCAVALLLSFSLAQAQNIGSDQAGATATVLWNLDITGMQDLQFDEISQGNQKIVLMDGTVEGLSTTGQEQPGKFKITTPQGFQIQFKNLPTSMIGPEGNDMPIEFFAAWSNTQFPDETELNVFDVSNSLSIESTGSVRDIYLFLGARVEPGQTQQIGDYQVEVTLSIVHGIQ